MCKFPFKTNNEVDDALRNITPGVPNVPQTQIFYKSEYFEVLYQLKCEKKQKQKQPESYPKLKHKMIYFLELP